MLHDYYVNFASSDICIKFANKAKDYAVDYTSYVDRLKQCFREGEEYEDTCIIIGVALLLMLLAVVIAVLPDENKLLKALFKAASKVEGFMASFCSTLLDIGFKIAEIIPILA